MRVLVVDDEPEMLDALVRGLTEAGHDVIAASDGVAALTEERRHAPDAAIVDVMLPGMSGFELTRHFKARRAEMMVVLLTARDAVDDRIRGLDSGADDYMTKPFHLAELTARLRAIHRRDALALPKIVTVGAMTVDLQRHRAHVGKREFALSRTEFDVLRVLASSAGRPVTRTTLLEEVWDIDHVDKNVVDQYLSYLRRKLELYPTGTRIVTRRNVGFTLVAEDPALGDSADASADADA